MNFGNAYELQSVNLNLTFETFASFSMLSYGIEKHISFTLNQSQPRLLSSRPFINRTCYTPPFGLVAAKNIKNGVGGLFHYSFPPP